MNVISGVAAGAFQVCSFAARAVFHVCAFTARMLLCVVVGFGQHGPRAGSLAAQWMAGSGKVVAGSVYSVVQSFAMS